MLSSWASHRNARTWPRSGASVPSSSVARCRATTPAFFSVSFPPPMRTVAEAPSSSGRPHARLMAALQLNPLEGHDVIRNTDQPSSSAKSNDLAAIASTSRTSARRKVTEPWARDRRRTSEIPQRCERSESERLREVRCLSKGFVTSRFVFFVCSYEGDAQGGFVVAFAIRQLRRDLDDPDVGTCSPTWRGPNRLR